MKKKNSIIRGRFKKSVNQEAQKFSASHEIDRELYPFDILGSLSHAKMLCQQGIMTKSELKTIEKAMAKIKKELDSDDFSFEDALEDIHMHIESRLTEMAGKGGAKLHSGRSRNDQVVLDFRLYCKDAIQQISKQLHELQQVLLEKAVSHRHIIIPAYTHLQQAQPIRSAHYFLAYINMFERDLSRIKDCFTRLDEMPLGSGALAGTGLGNDRSFIAKELGFPKVTENSLDSVSDRDFAMELLFVISLISIHLSRFCEEIIIWFTTEFQMIELDQAFCTGSSLMPQKSNPDMAELIRGKTGRFMGNMVNLMTTMKALPLTYNRDLQEDKEALFDSVKEIKAALSLFTKMLSTMNFKDDIMDRQKNDYMLATDVAEYLVNQGIPFRSAHEITGNIVQYAIRKGKWLSELDHEEWTSFSTVIKKDISKILNFKTSVDSKTTFGGTALKEVDRQIKVWKNRFKKRKV